MMRDARRSRGGLTYSMVHSKLAMLPLLLMLHLIPSRAAFDLYAGPRCMVSARVVLHSAAPVYSD